MELIKKYFPELNSIQLSQYSELFDHYKNWNDKINVVSRKDIDNLYLHHVLHSMALIKILPFLAPLERQAAYGAAPGGALR